MIILNTKNPLISLYLLPYFVANEESALDIGWKLHERLKNEPDNTLCLVIFNLDKFQAFLTCLVSDRVLWIWQAMAKSGFKYAKLVFENTLLWGKSLGAQKVYCQCPKKRGGFFIKKYGFKIEDTTETDYVLVREIDL